MEMGCAFLYFDLLDAFAFPCSLTVRQVEQEPAPSRGRSDSHGALLELADVDRWFGQHDTGWAHPQPMRSVVQLAAEHNVLPNVASR